MGVKTTGEQKEPPTDTSGAQLDSANMTFDLTDLGVSVVVSMSPSRYERLGRWAQLWLPNVDSAPTPKKGGAL